MSSFGMTYEDVLGALPFGTARISATSKVSTVDLDGWIASAGAELAGVLAKAGISTDDATMDADVLEQVRAAIRAYCVWQALLKVGQQEALMREKRDEYLRLVKQYRDRPALLKGQAKEYRSNIDHERRRPLKFGRDYTW